MCGPQEEVALQAKPWHDLWSVGDGASRIVWQDGELGQIDLPSVDDCANAPTPFVGILPWDATSFTHDTLASSATAALQRQSLCWLPSFALDSRHRRLPCCW